MKKARTEKQIHLDAFQLYYDLGEERTLERVADEFMGGKYKVRTINQWSSDFKWKDRIREMEQKSAEEAQKKLMKKLTKKKADSLEFIVTYMDKVEKAMLVEERDNYFVKEYVELFKLLLLQTGEATERTENTNTNINELSEEDRELVKQLALNIKQDLETVEEEED